jgi:DNA-binding NarL/FixJ family response regulator
MNIAAANGTSVPRILVFDDHGVYRRGLCNLIGARIAHAEVIEVDSLTEALSQLGSDAFDLVLAGVNLSSLGQPDFLKAARETAPATRFAILSATDARADILATLAAGYHGFISKRQPDTDILSAITDILSGRIYVPRSLAEAGGAESRSRRSGGGAVNAASSKGELVGLTNRQSEVLSLLACGKSNKEIARALDIAEATTKIHMAGLLRALGVRNRTEAAYKAGKLVDRSGVPVPLHPTVRGSAARGEPSLQRLSHLK